MYREFYQSEIRNDKIKVQQKWEDFKKRRVEAIENYISMKKQSKAVSIMIQQAYKGLIIRTIWSLYQKYKKKRKQKMNAAKAALWLYVKLVSKQKRCGGIEQCLRNRLKNCFIWYFDFMSKAIYKRAK